jgi:hypothetical protein
MGPIFILLFSAGTIEQRGDAQRLGVYFWYGMSIEEFSRPAWSTSNEQLKAFPPAPLGRCKMVKRWWPWVGGRDAFVEGTFIDGGLIQVVITSKGMEGGVFADYLNNRFDRSKEGWIAQPLFGLTGPGTRFDDLFDWEWQRNGISAKVRLMEFARKNYSDTFVTFEEQYRRADETTYDRCQGKRQADQQE